jgi:hypothetical protein
VADRGEPEASCSEWQGDGTAGEDDRGFDLVATGPARAMGEARPGRHEPRWQGPPARGSHQVVFEPSPAVLQATEVLGVKVR